MYQNKNVLVLGMARSGISVSKLLAKYNNKVTLSDIKIKGNHNYENIMVAIIVSKEFGLTNDQIKSVLKDFGGG